MIIGTDFDLSDDARARHVHIIGQTGVGKSALLENMIAADLAAGHGIAVLDPHGSLAEAALALVPPHRFHEVRYLNPADVARPLGFNPLHGVPLERQPAAVDEIYGAFAAVWGWTPETAPRASYILRNLIAKSFGGTFLDALRLLTSDESRVVPLDDVEAVFWNKFYAWDRKYREEAIQPVVTRLGTLLSSPAIRNTLCQEPRFDLASTLNEGRILICNLDKGKLGETNSHLLGAFIVSGIVSAAMNRSSQFHQRPFYLYADEFQNFASESFSTALSESRKYGLSLTLAHQYSTQMPKQLMSAVLGNTGTTIAFRVGAEDAPLMASHLGGTLADIDLNPRILKELPNYECVARVLQGGAPLAVRLKTVPPPSPLHDRVEQVVRNSRIRFGRPVSLVKKYIARALEPPPKPPKVRRWK